MCDGYVRRDKFFDRVFSGFAREQNPLIHQEYADFIAPGRQSRRRHRELSAPIQPINRERRDRSRIVHRRQQSGQRHLGHANPEIFQLLRPTIVNKTGVYPVRFLRRPGPE
jgi:hypothetical protein